MANSYKHRSGDRKDGRLLRSLPAISKFIPYFLRDRGSSGILYEEDLDVTAADKCLRQERVNGYKNIGFLHFFIAAYIRCISMLPGLNRFIVGRRVFARDEIDIVLTVKRSETLESSDTRVKIRFEATDTIFDVYRKINTKIDELRTEEVSGTFEDLMESFSRAPRLFIRLPRRLLRRSLLFGGAPEKRQEQHQSQQQTQHYGTASDEGEPSARKLAITLSQSPGNQCRATGGEHNGQPQYKIEGRIDDIGSRQSVTANVAANEDPISDGIEGDDNHHADGRSRKLQQ